MCADNNTTGNTHQNQIPDFSKLSTFFKYCSDDPRVIEGLFKLHKIRFTQPWVLNDPLEFNPIIKFTNNGQNYMSYLYDGVVLPSEEQRLRTFLIEREINKFGILSLTRVHDSFDMWSHYSSGHKGFLIEFKSDFNKKDCMLSREGKEYPVNKVTYVDEYAIDIDLQTDIQGNISQEQVNKELFFKKISRWESELEYRMVRPLTDCPEYTPLSDKPHRDDKIYLFDFDLDCISLIIFGACMSAENKKYIISCCEGKEIKFAQAFISRDEKDTEGFYGKIDIIFKDDWPDMINLLPFSFVSEKKHVEYIKKIIEINHLSDLPYYRGLEEWVEELYRNRKAKQKEKP